MRELSYLLLTAGIMSATSTYAATGSSGIEDNKPRIKVQQRAVEANSQDIKAIVTRDASAGIVMLKGSVEEVEQTRRLINKPALRPETVNVNVTIAVSETETGKGKIIDEFKLTTIDGSSAELQFGQQANVRSGSIQANARASMMGGGAGTQRTVYSSVSIGTMVEVVPKVTPDGIFLQVKVEKSWVEDGVVSGDQQTQETLPTRYSGSTSTSVFVSSGQNATMQAIVSGGTSNGRLMIITLSATTGSEVAERSRSVRDRVSSEDTGRSDRINVLESDKPVRVVPDSKSDDRTSQPPMRKEQSSRNEPGRSVRQPDEANRVPRKESPTANFGELLFRQIDRNQNNKIDGDETKMILPSLKAFLGGNVDDVSRKQFIQQADKFLQMRIDARKRDAKD